MNLHNVLRQNMEKMSDVDFLWKLNHETQTLFSSQYLNFPQKLKNNEDLLPLPCIKHKIFQCSGGLEWGNINKSFTRLKMYTTSGEWKKHALR